MDDELPLPKKPAEALRKELLRKELALKERQRDEYAKMVAKLGGGKDAAALRATASEKVASLDVEVAYRTAQRKHPLCRASPRRSRK